jgi:hypothetical protein
LALGAQTTMDQIGFDTVGQLMFARALLVGSTLPRDAGEALRSACRSFQRHATRGVARSAVQRFELHYETHQYDPENVLLGLRAAPAVHDGAIATSTFDLMARVREAEQALVAPQLHRELLAWLSLGDQALLSRARALARCAVEAWPAGSLVLVPDDAAGSAVGRLRFGRFSGRRVGLSLGVFTTPAERSDSLFELAHVLPGPRVNVDRPETVVEGAFTVFLAAEKASAQRCLRRYLTLHGFDWALSDALTADARTSKGTANVVLARDLHALCRNAGVLTRMKTSADERHRCFSIVRRLARAAAVRMLEYCDAFLSCALEIGEANASAEAAAAMAAVALGVVSNEDDGTPIDIGRPLVTRLIDDMLALPRHANEMVARLEDQIRDLSVQHRVALRALGQRLDSVRNGSAKEELHAWWMNYIKQSTQAFMRAAGVDLDVIGNDYIVRPPSAADLVVIGRNTERLTALLDEESDAHNTKGLLEAVCERVYPQINQFVDDALVAVAIACAVAPSVYERAYNPHELLALLRSHLAELKAAPLAGSGGGGGGADDDTDDEPPAHLAQSENLLSTSRRNGVKKMRRRSMSSVSLSDSDRHALTTLGGLSNATSIEWCDAALDDVEYLLTMQRLERAGVSAERLGPVPVSGLVIGRITRHLFEHRTVLELFGEDGSRRESSASAIPQSSRGGSMLASLSLFRRRPKATRRLSPPLSPKSPPLSPKSPPLPPKAPTPPRSPRSPRSWFSRPLPRSDGSFAGSNTSSASTKAGASAPPPNDDSASFNSASSDSGGDDYASEEPAETVAASVGDSFRPQRWLAAQTLRSLTGSTETPRTGLSAHRLSLRSKDH